MLATVRHSLQTRNQLVTKFNRFNFSSGVQAELETEIKANPIVVYSKSYCPHCDQTKATLKALKTTPAPLVHELDLMDDGAAR